MVRFGFNLGILWKILSDLGMVFSLHIYVFLSEMKKLRIFSFYWSSGKLTRQVATYWTTTNLHAVCPHDSVSVSAGQTDLLRGEMFLSVPHPTCGVVSPQTGFSASRVPRNH